MQQVESTVLFQHLTSLTEGFSHLSTRLSQAASALQAMGTPPARGLIEDLIASRKGFNELCVKGLAVAESLAISPLPAPDTLHSLHDLKSLLQAIAQTEEKNKAVKDLHQQALMVLERVQGLGHHDHPAFPALLDCQARASALHQEIAETPWVKPHPSAESLAKEEDPFSALLLLVERIDELDDEQCAVLQDTVERAFSKPLTIAALRGKLFVNLELPQTASAATQAAEPIPGVGEPSHLTNGVSREEPEEERTPVTVASSLHSEAMAKPESEETPLSSPEQLEYQEEPVRLERPEPKPRPAIGLLAPATEEKKAYAKSDNQSFYYFGPEEKSHKIASLLLHGNIDNRPAVLCDLSWRLLFEEKTGLAFHVARSLESQHPDFRPYLPSWLLRALVFSQRVRNPNGEIARLLKEDFAQFYIDCCTTGDPEWDIAVELLLAATALYPALLAPETQASAILHAVQFGGEFEQFSAYCHAVASYGDALQPLEVPSLKKQGRSHPKEPGGFVRRWMGSQDSSANQRKDALPEHTEYVRQEILNRYSDAMEELNLYKQLNSSIPVIGSVVYCRRALENVHALFDPEAPFLTDEPLPRALLYADLSRLPSLTLSKLGEIEPADQEILNEGLLKLVANGALKMI